MKNITICVLLALLACSAIDNRWQKQAVMLVVQNDKEIDSVFPLDTSWRSFVVEINDTSMLNPDRLKEYVEMGKLAGFEVMRVLLYNEVVNVPLKK